jgi:hypothetical protein
MRTCDDATADGITMQLMIRRDVVTDVQVVQLRDGGQCNGRYDDAFDRMTGRGEQQRWRQKRLMINYGGGKLENNLGSQILSCDCTYRT